MGGRIAGSHVRPGELASAGLESSATARASATRCFSATPRRRTRDTSEFHGVIYQTDERESGRLLMREPNIQPGPVHAADSDLVDSDGGEGPSPRAAHDSLGVLTWR